MATDVYLSPHFDDAVLSCGGNLARALDGDRRPRVVTLFAAARAYATQVRMLWGTSTAMERELRRYANGIAAPLMAEREWERP